MKSPPIAVVVALEYILLSFDHQAAAVVEDNDNAKHRRFTECRFLPVATLLHPAVERMKSDHHSFDLANNKVVGEYVKNKILTNHNIKSRDVSFGVLFRM